MPGEKGKETTKKDKLAQCPNTCYCQKEAKTWQERMKKAQLFLELAERESKEAEKLRIKETAHWLSQQFKQYHE
ncbi:1351_t:CDS:2 [Entrophospora sp. SA101]|nr:1351_t:CDS:2 [Entrophospora sp. SA101]